MFYKVKEVRPLPGFLLGVVFENGVKKQYDVTPLLNHWIEFQSLRDVKGLFEQIKVDAGGYGVSWNDDIDLSCGELWEHGLEAGEVESA